MGSARAAPQPAYTTSRRRFAHSHCAACGVALPGRWEDEIVGPARRGHACAYSDMRECPGRCGAPIVRRLPDGAPLNLNLTPHRCPGDDPEAGYLADLEAGVEAGVWPWVEGKRRRAAQAEARERDAEAERYAAWVAYRRARGIPDAGEAEVPPGRERPV